jgi:uncharacterized protein (DUF433 family)
MAKGETVTPDGVPKRSRCRDSPHCGVFRIHYILARIETAFFTQRFDPMSIDTRSRYVTRNNQILGGEPIIEDTRTSVRAIVGLWRLGVMPEEIPTHLPHLTLAQVFDALSFYLDYQSEINEYIERNQVPDELVHPSVKSVLGTQ